MIDLAPLLTSWFTATPCLAMSPSVPTVHGPRASNSSNESALRQAPPFSKHITGTVAGFVICICPSTTVSSKSS